MSRIGISAFAMALFVLPGGLFGADAPLPDAVAETATWRRVCSNCAMRTCALRTSLSTTKPLSNRVRTSFIWARAVSSDFRTTVSSSSGAINITGDSSREEKERHDFRGVFLCHMQIVGDCSRLGYNPAVAWA